MQIGNYRFDENGKKTLNLAVDPAGNHLGPLEDFPKASMGAAFQGGAHIAARCSAVSTPPTFADLLRLFGREGGDEARSFLERPKVVAHRIDDPIKVFPSICVKAVVAD